MVTMKEIFPKNKDEWDTFKILIQNKVNKHSIEQANLRAKINPKVRDRDNGKCFFCGKNVYEVGKIVGGGNTIHHKHPLRYRGKHKEENLITICAYCHQKLEKMINIVEREAIKHTLIYIKKQLKNENNRIKLK